MSGVARVVAAVGLAAIGLAGCGSPVRDAGSRPAAGALDLGIKELGTTSGLRFTLKVTADPASWQAVSAALGGPDVSTRTWRGLRELTLRVVVRSQGEEQLRAYRPPERPLSQVTLDVADTTVLESRYVEGGYFLRADVAALRRAFDLPAPPAQANGGSAAGALTAGRWVAVSDPDAVPPPQTETPAPKRPEDFLSGLRSALRRDTSATWIRRDDPNGDVIALRTRARRFVHDLTGLLAAAFPAGQAVVAPLTQRIPDVPLRLRAVIAPNNRLTEVSADLVQYVPKGTVPAGRDGRVEAPVTLSVDDQVPEISAPTPAATLTPTQWRALLTILYAG